MQAIRTVLCLQTGGSVRRSQWRVQLTEKGVDQQHQSMNATVATFYSWQRRGIAVVSHYRECPPILVCKCGSKSCSRVHVVVAEFWDTLQSQLPEEWLLFTKLFAGALWPLLFLLATTSRFLTGKAHPKVRTSLLFSLAYHVKRPRVIDTYACSSLPNSQSRFM